MDLKSVIEETRSRNLVACLTDLAPATDAIVKKCILKVHSSDREPCFMELGLDVA